MRCTCKAMQPILNSISKDQDPQQPKTIITNQPTIPTMSQPTGIQTIFGGAQFQREGRFADPSTLLKVYDALGKANVRKIDTAHVYGASEEILGQTGGSTRFDIDTKAPGGLVPGSVTAQGVQGFAHRSKTLLGVEQVDVYYLHAPDVVPIEETLAGVNEIYKKGWFKRFGLSNFFAEDVQKIFDICQRESYPLPTVYQGDYSAIARKQEEELLPLLRKLGIVSHQTPSIERSDQEKHTDPIQPEFLRLLPHRRRLPHQIRLRHHRPQRPLRPIQHVRRRLQ